MGPGADRYHLGGGGAPRRRRQAALAAGRCRPTGRSPLCGSAAALGRGADVRLAGAVPAVEQGLRVPASDFGEFHLPRDESYPPPEADRLMAFQTPFNGARCDPPAQKGRSFPYAAGRSGFSRTALLYKLCVELNVLDCRQRLRYRTALLRCLGLLLELGVVDAWDFAFGIELDAGDTESALYRLDVDLRRRADALRGEAG